MLLQSEYMDSEMLSVSFIKNDKYAVCGTGEGVINIFNYNEWGNLSDRYVALINKRQDIKIYKNFKKLNRFY